jgi:hypothetical protein
MAPLAPLAGRWHVFIFLDKALIISNYLIFKLKKAIIAINILKEHVTSIAV